MLMFTIILLILILSKLIHNMVFSNKHLPIKINYGIVIIDLDDISEDGASPVLHFVGLSKLPNSDDMLEAVDEFVTKHPEYDTDSSNLSAQLADEKTLKIYKNEYLLWLTERN